MLDLWEVIGRIVTSSSFRDQFFGKFQVGNYQLDKAGRANIDPTHYDTARAIISTVITDRPLSLMALGESLYTISVENNRKWLYEIAHKTGDINNGSEQFYQAIGALIFDSGLREKYRQETKTFCPA